jgi:ABC-2 type transport system permease protein
VPITVTLAAKMLAALPYALGVLGAMIVTAWAVGFLEATPLQLLRLGGALLLGALPFSLLGLAVGFQAKSSATAAILNAFLLPSAIASGLWMPLEIMPRFVQTLAPFLPTYHLGRLAVAQVTGDPAGVHALALVAMALVMAAAAAVSYRFARS